MHTIGMLVLGAVCLMGVGLAYDVRAASPVSVPSVPQPIGTFGQARPVRLQRDAAFNATLRGVAQTTAAAADALQSWQRAAPLLDAAWHVAQVVAYVGARPDHRLLLTLIESAREAVQNGNPAEAARLARRAVRIADTAAPAAIMLVPATDATYRGAVVIDANGSRLGTIASIDEDRVVIESGGLRDILGFITLRPGVRKALPRAAVLLGAPGDIGETLAIAPALPLSGSA